MTPMVLIHGEGCSLPAIVALLGERVRGLVFVACTVPPDGHSAFDSLEASIQSMTRDADQSLEPREMDPVTRTWIRTLQDQIVPPAKQLGFAANAGDCPVVDIAGGHMCMVSQPAALAELLNGLSWIAEGPGGSARRVVRSVVLGWDQAIAYGSSRLHRLTSACHRRDREPERRCGVCLDGLGPLGARHVCGRGDSEPSPVTRLTSTFCPVAGDSIGVRRSRSSLIMLRRGPPPFCPRLNRRLRAGGRS